MNPKEEVARLVALVEQAKTASQETMLQKAQAREYAARAVQLVLERLSDALGKGGRLRGLPDLSPLGHRDQHFYGARLVGQYDAPLAGAASLVLTSTGAIVKVWVQDGHVRCDDPGVTYAEDLSALLTLLAVVLPLHCVASAATANRYEAISHLAIKVEQILAPITESQEVSP